MHAHARLLPALWRVRGFTRGAALALIGGASLQIAGSCSPAGSDAGAGCQQDADCKGDRSCGPEGVCSDPGGTTSPPAAIAPRLRLPPAMREREWISIERTGCYGACPQFTLTAAWTGSVEWIGKQDVDRLGPAYRVADAAELARIYEAFAGLDWLAIPQQAPGREDGCSTDAPTTTVTLGRGLIGRTLHDYHGCSSEAHTTMRALEERLIALLAAPGWIEGVNDERPPAAPPCRTAALRPLFIERATAPWTSFTDAALLHAWKSKPESMRIVGIDNGDANLAVRVDALGVSVRRRLHAYKSIDGEVVAAPPGGPAPGEIRLLLTPTGCPTDALELVDDA